MNQPNESQEPEAKGRILPSLSAVVVVGVLVLAVTLLPGCGKQPGGYGGGGPAAKTDPWKAARERLKKDTDLAGCRMTLMALSNELPGSDVPKPTGLSKEAEDTLAAVVPLNPDDRAEIRGGGFTPHDPVYLAECLYLRDAAQAIKLPPPPDETPEQEAVRNADLAFAWVCRQVYLNPFLAPVPEQPGVLQGTALPPSFVLRRGYGSGLERMYVFLALLQQFGLDGCLVGPPDAANTPAGFVALGPDQQTVLTGSPRGPFWAVGVRIGKEVRLYDPWRGVPFPAPLSELKTKAEAHKAWFESKDNVSGVTIEDARKATPYLAVTVNGLAPRLATLEAQLESDAASSVPVRLAVNPTALRDAFGELKPAFWNPPNDRFAYGRAARTFLPADQGGTDRSETGNRLYDIYLLDQVPATVFLPLELQNVNDREAQNRIRQSMAGAYGGAFLEPPSPRERIQRGQFHDAARDLVAKQEYFFRGLERLRNSPDAEQQFRRWAADAQALYDQLGKARLAQLGKAPTPESEAAIAEAKAAIENHWRANGGAVQLLVDRVVSPVGWAEATLLLAICKHEEAEVAQARLEAAGKGKDTDAAGLKRDAVAAWVAAAAEWRNYKERSAVHAGYTGRAAHVAALSARAQKLAGQK